MEIFPAIDIINKKAVRLQKGDYGTKEIFGEPEEIAKGFLMSGAKNLHMVDLDGAKSGNTDNFDVIEKVAKLDLFIEVGGGIRDLARIKRYLDCGVKRIILGTAAIKNPDLLDSAIATFHEAIAVGVDVKNGFAATDGWEKVTQINGIDFCRQLRDRGVKTVIYTDVSTDGMMKGTNLSAFEELAKIEGLNVVASGGVTYYDEIEELKKMGTYGVILGKALYKNLLSLERTLEIAK